jgi:hypothetical protein
MKPVLNEARLQISLSHVSKTKNKKYIQHALFARP